MGKWQERAKLLGAGAATCDNSDNRDNSPPPGPETGPIVTIVPIVPAPLPLPLRQGLERLRAMRPPRMQRPEIWAELVSDCLRLTSEGWAQQAIGLGWHPLQLWGVSAAKGGLVDLEGLGVWLAGRRVLLLDERTCLVESRRGRRSIFNRRAVEGASFIWDVGSGDHG